MDINRLVIASNRLPVVIKKSNDGEIEVKPGSGGLVTAVSPILSDKGGLWLGWCGSADFPHADQYLTREKVDVGYMLKAIDLTADEVRKYYYGFSNEVLWPLFHDLPMLSNFDPDYWPEYINVNRKFAETIAEQTNETDYIWVQDYQLILVASKLREMGIGRRTGFFLHIPFPPLDMFLKLPWRSQILMGLLAYDLVGFQTTRDRRNFINCIKTLIPGTRSSGRGQVQTLETPEDEVRVGSFPISIDFREFSEQARSQAVADEAWFVHEKFPNRTLILGVDRLDYSKGIPHRIRALENAFERYPEMREKVTFIQVVVPSRTDVPEYQLLKDEIERLVGQVNGKFTQTGWTPIHYIFRSLDRTELLALYRTCEIALITPLKDGMNLVAKEYCACNLEESGVLILSEFAGTATQLHIGAVLVNPFDIEGTADAIYQAYTMDGEEREDRMRRLRRSVQRNNIFRWVDSYLEAAIAKNLDDLPMMDETYIVSVKDHERYMRANP